jgi:glycosyltransferase involved in cell wall biosynthesis
MKLGILTSHPIQYQAPWFRALAAEVDVTVFFAHQPDAKQQGVGFGVELQWDVDLLSGYRSQLLQNISANPNVDEFHGCDTPEIEERIAAGGFDVFLVNGWYLKSYRQAMSACRRHGVPIMVRGDSQLATPRSWVKRALKQIHHRHLLSGFSAFLTVGQRHREYLLHYGVKPEKIHLVPHFIDNDWFAARAQVDRAKLRTSWGAAEEDFVTLFVGKFEPKKRPMDLLRTTGDHLRVFVGSGGLGEELRAAATSKTHFAGFKNQSELPACYAAADCLVLPSDGGETWGLVVNEAMACGIPAIVSDACGCAPDMISAGETGFTFPLGDVNALSDRIARLRKLKQDFRPALAVKLRQHSLEAATRGTLRAAETCLAHAK